MDSKAASKKVHRSAQVETRPKKSRGLFQQLFSFCTSSKKKQDRNSDKRSKSSKKTAKPRKNKVQESIKGTQFSTSRLNPEQIIKSKTRSRPSKNKRKENSTKEEKEKKETEGSEKKNRRYKENTQTKLTENFGNKGTRSSTSTLNPEQITMSETRSKPSKYKWKENSSKKEKEKKESKDSKKKNGRDNENTETKLTVNFGNKGTRSSTFTSNPEQIIMSKTTSKPSTNKQKEHSMKKEKEKTKSVDSEKKKTIDKENTETKLTENFGIKKTRSSTSKSNPEQIIMSKTRSKPSENKRKEHSTQKEKEKKKSVDGEKKQTIDKENTETKLTENFGIKKTRSSTSKSNPEQIIMSKTRSKPSENKRKEHSTQKEKEKKESEDREKKKRIDKKNTETKLTENFGNNVKEKKEKKEDRKERKEKDRKEKTEKESKEKEQERKTTGKREDEQKVTMEKKKEKEEVKEIQEIIEEKKKRKNHDMIDVAKVENKGEIESEAFSKSHNKDKKFSSFASCSTAVGGLYSGQRELPAVRMFPDIKKITNLLYEPPPTICVQKYDELPSTSFQFCAAVDSHKPIQLDINGPCSGYCARYLETHYIDKKWKKFAKKNCKMKIEGEMCKPQKGSKFSKLKKEPYPPFKDIVKKNWKKLQTRLPFLPKKSKKCSKKRYCRSHSGSEKKRSNCKFEKKCKRSSKKDRACSVRSSLESMTVSKESVSEE